MATRSIRYGTIGTNEACDIVLNFSDVNGEILSITSGCRLPNERALIRVADNTTGANQIEFVANLTRTTFNVPNNFIFISNVVAIVAMLDGGPGVQLQLSKQVGLFYPAP
jgi:hypothetical protein